MAAVPPSPMSPRASLGWSVLGAAALASAQLLGPNGAPIWLVPMVLVVLTVRASARQRVVAWALFTAGAAGPAWLSAADGAGWLGEAATLAVDLGLMYLLADRLYRRYDAFLATLGLACGRAVIERLWAALPYGEVFGWGMFRLESVSLTTVMVLGGLSALSALIVFVGASFGLLLAEYERRNALRTTALAVSMLAILGAVGLDRAERQVGETVRVAAVASATGTTRRQIELTDDAAGEANGAQVVVWPRDSIDLSAGRPEEWTTGLASLAHEDHLWLIYGALRQAGLARAVVATPTGWTNTDQAFGRPSAPGAPPVTPAGMPRVFPAGFGGLGALLGDDLAYARPARDVSADGATVLAAPAADRPWRRARDELLARVRAAENAVVLIRASATGTSSLIDPFGRVVTSADVRREPDHALVADVAVQRDGMLLAGGRRRFPGYAAAILLLILLLRPNWHPPVDPDCEPTPYERR